MPTLSAACRTTDITPVHSSAKSAGPPQMRCTSATGSVSRALIVWVAPSSSASLRRLSWRSTAMIVVAGVSRAASTAERPTAPAPYTTMLAPGPGRQVLSTAPAPVETPQASGPSSSSGASCGTTTSASAQVSE